MVNMHLRVQIYDKNYHVSAGDAHFRSLMMHSTFWAIYQEFRIVTRPFS
ncbi:MAG: hypothetical protein J07HQW2_00825 [Haloquadratum walsbyi J07HQW2]|uniref:Uncharacterized protein n=1 Tax=Haloquadratum walsbyi J07HQW2 TaxID=1238425 RepID=U1PQ14_9EURY|nr:MAG: hypothetical protein J07HQW2_00825 [Haloquadratum walsbyi J07HQW2]